MVGDVQTLATISCVVSNRKLERAEEKEPKRSQDIGGSKGSRSWSEDILTPVSQKGLKGFSSERIASFSSINLNTDSVGVVASSSAGAGTKDAMNR